MPSDHLDRVPSRLPVQRLGFLPTLRYWEGSSVTPVRATIASLSTGAAVWCTTAVVSGTTGMLTSALCGGAATLVAVTLGLGLTERWARRRANRWS
jgi:hypothetical protein